MLCVKNGNVHDAVTREAVVRDILIENGKIVAMGEALEIPADAEVIAKANNSVSLAVTQQNSSVFQSVIGANRLLEGGSFLNTHELADGAGQGLRYASLHQRLLSDPH